MSAKLPRAVIQSSTDALGRDQSAAIAGIAWRASAAYLYLLRLDGPSLAWEYLRRNPDYRRDWARRRRVADPAAARWRLAAFEDPNLDARVALPLWRPQSDGVLRLVAYPVREFEQPRPFSLWPIAGRKSLCHDGHCLLLEIVVAGGTTRVALPDDLSDGDGYAHVVRVDAQAARRWREIKQCQALLLRGRAARSAAVRTRLDRVALAHMRSLQALDGALAGASRHTPRTSVAVKGGGR